MAKEKSNKWVIWVVVGVIGLVLATGCLIIAVPMALSVAAFGAASGAQTQNAEVDGQQVRSAVMIHQVSDPGSCPSLADLRGGGYLGAGRELDPWANEFTIECGNGDVVVRSRGPDGEAGTDDDIVIQ